HPYRLLFQEWQLLDILQRPNIRRLDADLVVQITVKLVLVVGALDHRLKTLQLQRLQLAFRERFDLFIEEFTVTHDTFSSLSTYILSWQPVSVYHKNERG